MTKLKVWAAIAGTFVGPVIALWHPVIHFVLRAFGIQCP